MGKPVEEGGASDRHARRQIIVRGVVAGGLIVALLAGLIIFEREEPPAPSIRTVTRAMPSAVPRTEPIASSAPAASAVAAANAVAASPPVMSPELTDAIKNAPDAAQAALASMAQPAVAPTAVPEETYDPTVPLGEEAAPPPKRAQKAGPTKSGTDPHVDRPVVESPARTSPTTSVARPQTPTVAATAQGGYVVQMGVFANATNAEELHARLSLYGIPSQIETRVQVGPFTTREQALKTQEKLRTLGMGSGILVAAKKR